MEQNPKSVPKNGRKLVVFADNASEPNLEIKLKELSFCHKLKFSNPYILVV